MKARRLIELQAAFDPEQLLVVTSAFEAAWALVQGSFVGEANREAARLRLANLVIDLARRGVIEPDHLTEMAIEAMHRPLH